MRSRSNQDDEPPRAAGRFGDIQLECMVGVITEQPDVAAIVNPAEANLLPGGGLCGAIHRAAGPGLAAECRPLAPLNPGQAVITAGHQLPNPYVIHCCGPLYGVDEPAAALLGDCYRHALQLADARGLDSAAFPLISAGSLGYPFMEATEVACGAILEMLPALRAVKLIRLVFLSRESARAAGAVFSKALREWHRPQPGGGR